MSSGPPGVLRRGLRLLALGIRLEPRPFAVGVLGAAVYAGMTVASSVVLGEVTDRVVIPAFGAGGVGGAALAAAAAALVGVAVLKSAGIVARRVGASAMQLRLESHHREAVTRQFTRLPLAWHRRHPAGTLLSHANSDVQVMWWPIAPLPFSVGVLFLLAVTLVLLVLTDLYLTLLALLFGPLMGYVNWRYNRVSTGPATRAQEERGVVSDIAHESFDGALVVKTLGREPAEEARFRAASERLRDELVIAARIRALYDPVMEALPSLAILAVIAVGTWRVAGGHLTTGALVEVSYLFSLLAFPIRAIGWVLADLPRAVVGWERVDRVLGEHGGVPYGSETAERSGPAAVDLVQVRFAYSGDPVLADLTFAAPPGRTIAVVGPTGAGKSTIASLLVRLADPDEGAVQLDGRDLRSLQHGELSRQAAIVFQETFLFDDTVRENITLGASFTDEEVRAACALARADAFVNALPQGYDTRLGERGTSLSGGQRQRIALARALVRRPRLLILDDATSSVDPTVEAEILRGLIDADLPSTVVVVAYRSATIALADEIVYVAGGRVADRGTHDELLARLPAYRQLVSAYDRRAAT